MGTLSPTGVLECAEGEMMKVEGSLTINRPLLSRGVSLEDQMLTQAGYGVNGESSLHWSIQRCRLSQCSFQCVSSWDL